MIALIVITSAFLIYLTFRNWFKYGRYGAIGKQKLFTHISQLIALSKWDAALNDLTPLLKENDKHAHILHLQVLRGMKQHDAALERVYILSKQFPEELLFRLEEGKILMEKGLFKEALASFRVCEPILRSEPDLLEYAKVYFEVGSIERSLELLEPLLPFSKNAKLILLTGLCYFEQKNYLKAITLYEKAIELGDKQHLLFISLGRAYQKLGNLKEAEMIFRSLIEKDSGDIAATLGLGECMQERGLYDRALFIYQSGNAWEKKDSRLLEAAGICALHLKKFSFAELYFFEAIQRHHPSNHFLSNYGYCLECQNKWLEAEQIYLKQVELYPAEPQGYRALAWLFGVGLSHALNQEQGLNYAHMSLKYLPDITSWEILSACEARAGNYLKAHQIHERLASQNLDKNSKNRYQTAMRLLRKCQPLDGQVVIRSNVA